MIESKTSLMYQPLANHFLIYFLFSNLLSLYQADVLYIAATNWADLLWLILFINLCCFCLFHI